MIISSIIYNFYIIITINIIISVREYLDLILFKYF